MERGSSSLESPETWRSSVGVDGGPVDVSTVTVVQSGGGSKARRGRDSGTEDESAKLVSTSSGNETEASAKHMKATKSRKENESMKTETEASSRARNKLADHNSQPSEAPKQDYIHVRARRGQATDSHSLAERARREKISERMKILQDLVPGCSKVIGKALVLDEIINYIQALQRQVEFLSMKLEAVNSRIGPVGEVFPPKEFGAQVYDAASDLAFSSGAAREYTQVAATEWLHMQVGSTFEGVS